MEFKKYNLVLLFNTLQNIKQNLNEKNLQCSLKFKYILIKTINLLLNIEINSLLSLQQEFLFLIKDYREELNYIRKECTNEEISENKIKELQNKYKIEISTYEIKVKEFENILQENISIEDEKIPYINLEDCPEWLSIFDIEILLNSKLIR